jgi:hypothetical protein
LSRHSVGGIGASHGRLRRLTGMWFSPDRFHRDWAMQTVGSFCGMRSSPPNGAATTVVAWKFEGQKALALTFVEGIIVAE